MYVEHSLHILTSIYIHKINDKNNNKNKLDKTGNICSQSQFTR